MEKLRLDLEDLVVESFTTLPRAEERGTVRARSPQLDPSDPCTDPTHYESCQPEATCETCWSDAQATVCDALCSDTCEARCGIWP